MSVVQNTYQEQHDHAAEGQIADLHTCDVDSYILAGDTAVPFGRAVQKSATAGENRGDQCVAGVSTNDFLGVAVIDRQLRSTEVIGYKKGDAVSVLVRGDVYVRVHAAVTRGANVVCATETHTGSSQSDPDYGELIGQFSSKTADTEHIAIAGARFMTAGSAGSLVRMRLAGPLPTA